MAGYTLSEEVYKQGNLSEDMLWDIFNNVFSSKAKRNTSYKFAFFKSILDSLNDVDDTYMLTFDQLFGRFTEIYWNLVLKYQLCQKVRSKDKKEAAVENILKENFENQDIRIEYTDLADNIRIEICDEIKKKCKINVVGALYRDSEDYLYSFSKKLEIIQINPAVYTFLVKYKSELENMNYFGWAVFLEKVNKDISNIENMSDMMNQKDLLYYREILRKEFTE